MIQRIIFMECETCAYYAWDEETEEYLCEADMDQDDLARLTESRYHGCPYWREGDEYKIVRHQA